MSESKKLGALAIQDEDLPTGTDSVKNALLDLAELPDLPHKAKKDPETVRQEASRMGFKLRQHKDDQIDETSNIPVVSSPQKRKDGSRVDARTLRKSKKTDQLNIAVEPELKDWFWDFAAANGVTTGNDCLKLLKRCAEALVR